MSEFEIKHELKKTIPWRLAVIFLLFSTAIILAGIFYYDLQKKLIFKEQENNLSAIAILKISQIESWHNERIEDATVISLDKPLIRIIEQSFSGKRKEVKADISEWMKSVKNEYDFSNVVIADTSFKIRLSVTPSDSVLGDSIKSEIKTAFKGHRIFMTDLHRSKEIHYVHIDLLIPLFDSVMIKPVPVGIVILRIDPNKVLFPLIQSWPTLSKSSETLLLRKDRDSILYLNELRHAKNTALKLKFALTNRNLLGVKAVNGFEGVTEGIDYRNIPVVGALHKIPDTSWFMVAKVDKAELLSPLKKYVFLITMVIILLILINASIFGFWIWQQRIKFFKSQLKNEVSLNELEERFTTAFRMSPVSVTISSVNDNKFIDINNTFLNDMGYTREEVIGRTAKELNIWAEESERLWIINEITEKGRIFGKVISYKTKTGKILYGLSSMAVVKVNGEPCNLSTVVNITENKKAEEQLKVSEELFRKLFENMLNGFAYCKMLYEDGRPVDFLYLNVNESFGSLTGLKDVVGKRASEAIPGIQEADPGLIERYGRVASTGNPEVFETYVESLKMWFSISVYSPQKEYFVAVFDVITTRKLAEDALRVSEERYRNIFNSLIEGFCIIEMVFDEKNKPVDYRFLEINSSFEKQTGLYNVKGKLMREMVPDNEDYWYEIYGKVALTGEPERFENEAKALNRWFEVRASRVNDQEGYKVAIYFNDITERKTSEIALRESEDKFKYIFDHSVIGKSITFPTGEIHVNKAFCDMLGYSQEELEKTKWQDISHPDDIHETEAIIRTLLSGEKDSVRFIKRYLHKNGNVVWTDVSTFLRRNAGNNPEYFITMVNDITDLKLAEDILRNDQKRFRELIESLPQLYWTCSVDGPCDYLSRQWVEYTGIPESDQLGYRWLEQLHPEDREKTITAWAEKVKAGTSFDIEFRIRRYDGEYHWFKTRAVPIHDSEGKLIRWLGSNTDIDSIRKAEDQLQNYNKDLEQSVILRTEQLEAANKELESFSYSVSHDLRAPLRSVHGYTKILMEEYDNMLDDEGKRICGIISSSATQMGELIDDLLNFSRIGRTSMNPMLLDMRSIVLSAFADISSEDEKTRINLKIGKLYKAFGDSNLLRMVWNNLISNAIKYTSKAAVSEISIGSSLKYGSLKYFIKDNGVGFDMNYKHKLFGVFQRLHSEAEFEGNGVGLAIVQRIILKHGGRVWAESEVGKGATFYFSLPVDGVDNKK